MADDQIELPSTSPSGEQEVEYDAEADNPSDDSKIQRKSALYSEREGLSLEFDNISLSTKSKNHEKDPPKQIVKGISSHFRPSDLTAIMGYVYM